MRSTWLRLARRAALLRLSDALLTVGLPAALALWLAGALIARRGLVPPAVVGFAGLLTGALAVILRLAWRRGLWRRPGLDRNTARALDWRAGLPGDAKAAETVWRRAVWAGRDPWWTALAAALLFGVLLNTAFLWGPSLAALWGRPTGWLIEEHAPLVRLRGLEVVDPDGSVRDLGRGDGFLRVDEGAVVRWRVEPLRPATAVTLWQDEAVGVTLPIGTDGTAAFAVTAIEAFSYRFSLWRWDVERRERLARRVDVRPDQAPSLRWEERPPARPPAGVWIRFAWRALDDRGVADVALEAVGDGRTVRIELATYAEPVTDSGVVAARIDLAELPPGERLSLTLVGRDADPWDGPNIGRSETLVLTLDSPEAAHEAWLSSLTALLREGVRVLGDGLEAPGPRAKVGALAAAADLAARSDALAAEAQGLRLRGRNAEESLAAIAAEWRRATHPPSTAAIAAAEEAVWATDRLIGREEAARLEWEQEQLVSRLENLTDELDTMGDADLERLMRLIEREMRDVADAMQTRRPQLPSELLQEDALKPEADRERIDRMQAARDAMARGDREEARRQLEALLDELREAREGMQKAAGADQQLSAQAAQGARGEARRLEEMAKEQEALGEAQQAWETRRQGLDESTQALAREAFGGEEGARARELSRALREGDAAALQNLAGGLKDGRGGEARRLAEAWRRNEEDRRGLIGRQEDLRERTGALRESGPPEAGARRGQTLQRAEEKQEGAARALAENSGGEAAMQAWQAAEALREAAALAREREQQAQAQSSSPSFLAPQSRPDGAPRQEGQEGNRPHGDEAFAAPEAGPQAGSRAEILRGFREGIPDAGREVGERYLDRLLH